MNQVRLRVKCGFKTPCGFKPSAKKLKMIPPCGKIDNLATKICPKKNQVYLNQKNFKIVEGSFEPAQILKDFSSQKMNSCNYFCKYFLRIFRIKIKFLKFDYGFRKIFQTSN